MPVVIGALGVLHAIEGLASDSELPPGAASVLSVRGVQGLLRGFRIRYLILAVVLLSEIFEIVLVK